MAHATVRHSHHLTFIAKGKSNHWTAMDVSAESGGDGAAATPKELLLFALGGCTGTDVASILRKKRLDVRAFALEIEADEVADTPKVFTEARISYVVDGPGIAAADVERAIHLSLEKYCSVSAMLRKAFPIRWKAVVNGEEIAAGVEGAASA
jgi:putative redox protein